MTVVMIWRYIYINKTEFELETKLVQHLYIFFSLQLYFVVFSVLLSYFQRDFWKTHTLNVSAKYILHYVLFLANKTALVYTLKQLFKGGQQLISENS